jgi:hypothetical protein
MSRLIGTMSSKVVDTAETSDAANIPISEKNQCLVADEDIEDIVELSTAGGPTDIDEMGPPEKRKLFPGCLANIDEFINSLIVPDDFVLDESGLGLIHIKGIDIKHICQGSSKNLREIYLKCQGTGMARKTSLFP